MAIVTVGELLDRVNEHEQKVQAFYEKLRDQSPSGGVKLLTYYLCKHRRHQEKALKDLGPADIARIRRIELKYDVSFNEGAFSMLEASPDDVDGEKLLEAAIDYDKAIVAFYNRVLEQPMRENARDLIAGLVRLEERDIVMLKKTLATRYF